MCYRPRGGRGVRRKFNKYNSVPVHKPGKWFSSRLESALHDYLLEQERAGEISDIRQQVRVKLTLAEIVYIPDFSAVDVKTGQTCYYESKGFETDVWRIKRRLWVFYGNGPLYVFKGTYKKLYLHEVIIPRVVVK